MDLFEQARIEAMLRNEDEMMEHVKTHMRVLFDMDADDESVIVSLDSILDLRREAEREPKCLKVLTYLKRCEARWAIYQEGKNG